MGLVLRVEVLRGRNLAAKDKGGTSDPFLVLTLGEQKEATSVISKTLNPEWNQTFELPVLTADSALLEAVCWDKDRFRNDYMGEFDVVLEDMFVAGSTSPDPMWFPVKAKRSGRRKAKKDSNISGEIQIKFTLYDPVNPAAIPSQILQKFYGVVAEDADDDDEDDDDLLARIQTRDLDDLSEEDDEDKDPSDETDEGPPTPSGDVEEKQRRRRRAKIKKLKRKSKLKAYEFSNTSDVAGVLFLEINRITDLPPEKNMTRTSFDMDPFVVASLGRKTYRTRVIKHDLNPVYDEKLVFQVVRQAVNYQLNFAVVDRDKFSGNDFVGTASFPLSKVTSLQPDADPETGLYPLPEYDAHSGSTENERKKRFRIPLSRTTSRDTLGRSSRNSSSTNLSRPHRSASSNSLNSQSRPTLTERGSSGPAPTSDPRRSVPEIGDNSALSDDNDHDLVAFELPLELKNKARWEAKHSPVLYMQAKYMSYQALRQQFWRAMLRQYDVDDSGTLDKVELTTMLDTLGSTLHNSTVNGFFNRFKRQNGGEEVLTMDQAVICLEEQLRKSQETQKSMHSPHWKKSKVQQVKTHESSPNESPGGTTPALQNKEKSNLDPATASVPSLHISDLGDVGESGGKLPDDDLNSTESDLESDLGEEGDKEEHVVEIQECPICHQPRLARGSKTTDADIITHIATCASSDWRAVNNFVMAGFVTSSQAQRKWYSKVISKVCTDHVVVKSSIDLKG